MSKTNKSRRNFMGVAAGSMIGYGLGAPIANAKEISGVKSNSDLPKGKLLTFGMNSETGVIKEDEVRPRRGNHSILNSIDIQTGEVKSTALEMGGEGHMAMGIGDGRILCTGHHQSISMIVDQDHKIIAEYIAPEDYVYGGHGLILEDENKFILPARRKNAKTVSDTGILQVYDLTTMKLIDQVDSFGVHPHEPHRIPGTDEIVVSHYGDVYPTELPYEHRVEDGKLTIYDAKTLKVKRHYDQNDLKAMTTHMHVDSAGNAYFVLTQYVRLDLINEYFAAENPGLWLETPQLLEIADNWLAKEVMNEKREYPLSPQSLPENRIAVPLPLVRVNTQTGKRDLIWSKDKGDHLRGQTVGYNSLTDTILAVFYHSDMLFIVRPGKDEPELFDGAHIGLAEMRGVTDIPGTPFVGLHGSDRNVAIMNVITGEVIKRYRSQNYYSVHVGYTPI